MSFGDDFGPHFGIEMGPEMKELEGPAAEAGGLGRSKMTKNLTSKSRTRPAPLRGAADPKAKASAAGPCCNHGGK